MYFGAGGRRPIADGCVDSAAVRVNVNVMAPGFIKHSTTSDKVAQYFTYFTYQQTICSAQHLHILCTCVVVRGIRSSRRMEYAGAEEAKRNVGGSFTRAAETKLKWIRLKIRLFCGLKTQNTRRTTKDKIKRADERSAFRHTYKTKIYIYIYNKPATKIIHSR